MTLLNPWALAGLALLAVPILAHLIARRRTRVLPFPTLRFIARSRLQPVRTLRLSDPLLLALRCAIIAAAASALAQPRFVTAERARAAAAVLARAIIVDTSASMRRSVGSGERAADVARREAARLSAEADVAIAVESAEPAAQLRGAAEWLRHQAGAHEIVVISDFQTGTVDSAALARVPEQVGVAFVRVPAGADALPAGHIGAVEIDVRADVADTVTTATWTLADGAAPRRSALVMLAADGDSAAARATLAAVRALTPPPGDTAHAVAIVFPGHPRLAELEAAARPADAAWMGDVVASAAAVAPVRAGVAQVNGRERLLLFTDEAAGTVAAAELGIAAATALADVAPAAERDPGTLPDALLDTWRRAPGNVVTPTDETGGFDGRWFWLLALALLGIEMLVRRSVRREEDPAAEAPVEERHARVA